jgi:hypothetical protein
LPDPQRFPEIRLPASRDLGGPTVSVRERPKGPGPAVVVEEIAVQAIEGVQKAASTPPNR